MKSLPDRVVAAAKQLCASEGWNPDELVQLEEGLSGAGLPAGAAPRWRLYAAAAERQIADEDDWNVF